MHLQSFKSITNSFESSPKMPAIFIGHGHPMNALWDNDFTRRLGKIGEALPRPQAILMVSAHWQTRGTFVSLNPRPQTIHDFGRFDDRLFDIQYTPSGHPALAKEVATLLPSAHEDHHMGLDHGAWTVLQYIYPQADVPVFQLSIDYTLPLNRHFEMAQLLQKLRYKGVMLMGSGNIVHNLRRIDWHTIDAPTEDWALEFDQLVKERLSNGDYTSLVNYTKLGPAALASIPTEDHYLPMLYTLGMATKDETTTTLFEGFQFANISMRCFQVG